jgi:hypothetical protein
VTSNQSRGPGGALIPFPGQACFLDKTGTAGERSNADAPQLPSQVAVAERRSLSAEREGFSKAEIRNLPANQQSQSKSFGSKTLTQARHSSLFPVAPHCGGTQPGQVRDKWLRVHIDAAVPEQPPLSGSLPDMITFFLGGTSRRPSRSRRKGPRSRAETEAERRQEREAAEKEIDKIVAEFHDVLSRDQATVIGAIYARLAPAECCRRR